MKTQQQSAERGWRALTLHRRLLAIGLPVAGFALLSPAGQAHAAVDSSALTATASEDAQKEQGPAPPPWSPLDEMGDALAAAFVDQNRYDALRDSLPLVGVKPTRPAAEPFRTDDTTPQRFSDLISAGPVEPHHTPAEAGNVVIAVALDALASADKELGALAQDPGRIVRGIDNLWQTAQSDPGRAVNAVVGAIDSATAALADPRAALTASAAEFGGEKFADSVDVLLDTRGVELWRDAKPVIREGVTDLFVSGVLAAYSNGMLAGVAGGLLGTLTGLFNPLAPVLGAVIGASAFLLPASLIGMTIGVVSGAVIGVLLFGGVLNPFSWLGAIPGAVVGAVVGSSASAAAGLIAGALLGALTGTLSVTLPLALATGVIGFCLTAIAGALFGVALAMVFKLPRVAASAAVRIAILVVLRLISWNSALDAEPKAERLALLRAAGDFWQHSNSRSLLLHESGALPER